MIVNIFILLYRLYIKHKINQFYMKIMSYYYSSNFNWNNTCDALMEPLFWFIENFTGCLGPVS